MKVKRISRWKSWFSHIQLLSHTEAQKILVLYQYECSIYLFGAFWILILLLHFLLGFTALFLSFQHFIVMNDAYQIHQIQLAGIKYNKDVSLTSCIYLGCVTVLHGKMILDMLWASIKSKRLVFHSERIQKSLSYKSPTSTIDFMRRFINWPMEIYSNLFGIRGRYFEVVFFLRETIEISAIFVQAYQMSQAVSTPWINQYVVTILVLNCWSTPLLEFLFRKNGRLRRLVLVWLDLLLDLAISIGLPLNLVVAYYLYFVLQTNAPARFHEPDRLLLWMGEINLFVGMTWSYVFTGIIMRFSMLRCLNTLSSIIIHNKKIPEPKSLRSVAPATSQISSNSKGSQVSDIPIRRSSQKRKLLYAGMFLFGLIILLSHVNSSYQESFLLHPAATCKSSFRPWFQSQLVCSAVNINCHQASLNGSKAQMSPIFDSILQSNVRPFALSFSHCPRLEFPSQFTLFSEILLLELRNTTITEWSSNEALTATAFPILNTIWMKSVNFTDGLLPEGLLSDDFPASIQVLRLKSTNLESLPIDLDTKWRHRFVQIWVQESKLKTVPDSFSSIDVAGLLLGGDVFESVPPQLLIQKSYVILNFWGKNLSNLPELDPQDYPTIDILYLDDTNVSSLDEWMYPHFTNIVVATGSPLCGKLTNGTKLGTSQWFGHISCEQISDMIGDYEYIL